MGAQIAEAWARRRYEKRFVSKLSEADGKQMETRHWPDLAVDFGYASDEQIARSVQLGTEIGKMLAAMMAKAEHFCRPDALSVHEDQALYFASATETPNTGY